MSDYVMVTDWEEVDADDFYLSEDWAENVGEETLTRAKELQANGSLYIGYVVQAVNYIVYKQMDSGQIFIDEDGNEIMSCEGAIIENKHKDQFEYSY